MLRCRIWHGEVTDMTEGTYNVWFCRKLGFDLPILRNSR
jgi:hypothetical protein